MQTAGLAKLDPEPKEETLIVEDFSKIWKGKKAIKMFIRSNDSGRFGKYLCRWSVVMSKIHPEIRQIN